MTVQAYFGNTLRELRAQAGMMQQQVADKLFVSRKAVSLWENGERMPDLATIVKLAYALGVDEDVMYSAMRRAVGRLPHVAAVCSDPDELAAMGHMLNLILPDAQVIGFGSAAEAAAFSEKRPLSVLLIDLDGDPQAGLQFAEKAAEEGARINVIFMASSQDYAMQAFRCRASGYLIKPVTRESLFAEMNCLRYAVEGWTAAENSVKPE